MQMIRKLTMSGAVAAMVAAGFGMGIAFAANPAGDTSVSHEFAGSHNTATSHGRMLVRKSKSHTMSSHQVRSKHEAGPFPSGHSAFGGAAPREAHHKTVTHSARHITLHKSRHPAMHPKSAHSAYGGAAPREAHHAGTPRTGTVHSSSQ